MRGFLPARSFLFGVISPYATFIIVTNRGFTCFQLCSGRFAILNSISGWLLFVRWHLDIVGRGSWPAYIALDVTIG